MFYPLTKFLGQNTCDSIRNYLSAQIVQSISFKISSSLLYSEKGLRDRGSLVVKKSKHKGRVVLVCLELVKGIYKIVELSSGLLGDWM